MRCDEVLRFIGEYLDSELDPRTSMLVSRHLDSCPECRYRFEREQRVEAAISQGFRQNPTPEFWKNIERRVRGSRWRSFRWMFAAAALLLLVGSLVLRSRTPSVPKMSLAQESLRCHERVLTGEFKPEIRTAFAPGLSSRLGFSIHLSGVGRMRAKIDGARVCELGKQSIGLLFGEVESKPVTFIILHERVVDMFPESGRMLSARVQDYNFRALRFGEAYYCAIGEATPASLEEALHRLIEQE